MSTESYDADAYVVELRARIRELEAELEKAYREPCGHCPDMQARAEKAETESLRLERILERDHDENCQWRVAEVAKLLARVAEADACLEKIGVTWSGTAYIGMAREREEC